jgi:hypothetical protein
MLASSGAIRKSMKKKTTAAAITAKRAKFKY